MTADLVELLEWTSAAQPVSGLPLLSHGAWMHAGRPVESTQERGRGPEASARSTSDGRSRSFGVGRDDASHNRGWRRRTMVGMLVACFLFLRQGNGVAVSVLPRRRSGDLSGSNFLRDRGS